jgi:hypothetical protein
MKQKNKQEQQQVNTGRRRLLTRVVLKKISEKGLKRGGNRAAFGCHFLAVPLARKQECRHTQRQRKWHLCGQAYTSIMVGQRTGSGWLVGRKCHRERTAEEVSCFPSPATHPLAIKWAGEKHVPKGNGFGITAFSSLAVRMKNDADGEADWMHLPALIIHSFPSCLFVQKMWKNTNT